MKTFIKIILVLAVLLVLLVIGGFIFVGMSLNSLAEQGIEKGGTYALGVPTTVSSVDISLFSGSFAMSGFKVANPQGFNADKFLGLGKGAVSVNLQSLNQPVVELPSLHLDTIEANLEQNGNASNFGQILDHLKQVTGGGSGTSQPAPANQDDKRIIVRELLLKNIKVSFNLAGIPGLDQATRINVPIDEIRLENVGKTGEGVAGSGVTLGELAGIIVRAVTQAATEKAGDALPAAVLGDLKGKLGQFGELQNLQVVGEAKAVIEGAQQKVQQVTDDVKKQVDEGKQKVEKLGEDLKNLIPGKK